ncbi:MAG TPA: hypothetical protein DHW82_02200 [Spirochaetia bacterium]|nr:MAG: hypothetical protein A2Y41_07060 [Spirochaetes bacterium GWB1_36_13]HCL55806.1 hypothetical protein [Spirochaetia bacterium]
MTEKKLKKKKSPRNPKEETVRMIHLLNQWEEGFIKLLTLKANQFQEKNQEIRRKISDKLTASENLDVKQTKILNYINEKYPLRIEKMIQKIENQKIGLKRSFENLNKMMEFLDD